MTAATRDLNREQPIRADEHSGVLHPRNLQRFDARWFEPSPDVSPVVDQYWHVQWRVPAGELIDQRIIDLPATTLSIEEGNVPAPFVVTGVHERAWSRQIANTGSVFGIRLRPAGLSVVSDLTPDQIANSTVPVTPQLDHRLHALLSSIARETTLAGRARASDVAIRTALAERPPRPQFLLANDVLDELISRVHSRTGTSLASAFGVTERTIQRAFRETLGRGPKWASRRIRLQAVALALVSGVDDGLSALAADLGYTDQAHLTSDFRRTSGITPAAYVRSVLALSPTLPTSASTPAAAHTTEVDTAAN